MPLDPSPSLFDIPDDVTYLNCAAQSPCLKSSHAAGQGGLLRKLQPWAPDRANVPAEMERCRELYAGFLGATADDIAIVFSTSYGVAVAAANLSAGQGKSILVIEGQFPSNYYAWQKLARKDGGQLKVVAKPGDWDWTSAILDAFDDTVGLVSLPNCHWADGSLIDLEPIAAVCVERGIPLVIDATQSIGVHAIDITRVPADFIIASAYKWMLCPDLMGFMYVAPKHHAGEPIEHNHSTRHNAPSMEVSPGYADTLKPSARRFDMGAADSMVHLPMAVTALEAIHEWGPERIAAHCASLVDRAAELGEARGFTMPPKRYRIGHFIGLTPTRPLPEDLVSRLAEERIFISRRNNALRISPYIFNTEKDIDTLFAAIDRICGF